MPFPAHSSMGLCPGCWSLEAEHSWHFLWAWARGEGASWSDLQILPSEPTRASPESLPDPAFSYEGLVGAMVSGWKCGWSGESRQP